MQLAEENNLKTIAFPNISTGIYHFPKDEAAGIAISAVKDFLSEHHKIDKVIFVCFDDENYAIYEKLLSE
jgi:O-acetyl-ADP-ribose deacetylase (regulator of RNase III)